MIVKKSINYKQNSTATGELEAGEADYITIALKMREEVGNEYQDKSIGADFAIQLIATQLTAEIDSFDELYDEDSIYPAVTVAKTAITEAATEDFDSVGIVDLVEIDGYEGLYSIYGGQWYYADTAVFFNEYNAPELPDNMDAIVHNTAYNMNLD